MVATLSPMRWQLSMPIEKALAQSILPTRSKSMFGASQEPVSIILYLSNETTLLEAMTAAGWQQADPPGIATLSQAEIATLLDRPYETAPITPLLWKGWPQDFGFQKGLISEGLHQRYYARFCRARMQTSSDLVIFVGTASFGVGIKRELTHRINPNVNAERDLQVADPLQDGGLQQDGWVLLASRLIGQNVIGEALLTDGRTAVLSKQDATAGLQAVSVAGP